MGTVLVDEQAEIRLRGLDLAFDRLEKASTFVFNANSSNELHFRGFLLVVVVLFVDQVRDQLIQAMRNSDP